MSFVGLNYDKKAYEKNIQESKAVGNYILSYPFEKGCFVADPSLQAQRTGVSIDSTKPLIDIDSELMGLNRTYTKVPDEKYQPCCKKDMCKTSGYPCGQGVIDCNIPGLKPGSRPQDKNLRHFPDCNRNSRTNYTRLDHPICNMRGLTVNRWEWLCLDPQERVEIPFDHNINNRILVKDNHRPCIPKPLDQTLAMPKDMGDLKCNPLQVRNTLNTEPVSICWRQPLPKQCPDIKACEVPTDPVSVNWQTERNKNLY